MRSLHHASLPILYLMAAALAGAVLPRTPIGISLAEGYLLGAAVLVFGVLLHCSLARSGGLTIGTDPVVVLNGLHGMRIDLPMTSRAAEPDGSGATSTDGTGPGGARVDKVIAEVKVLQSLVERLYASRTTPAPAGEQEPVSDPLPVRNASASPDGAVLLFPAGNTGPVAPGPASPRPGPADAPRRAPCAKAVEVEVDLEVLRDALRRGQVELALQPVVSLPQRKRRFYECFSRIRIGDGQFLMPQQYIGLAERAGLIAAIDNTLLFRCIQLLRKTREHDLDIGFFCNISQHTLADRAFFRDFVRFMGDNAGLASSIHFEFPQHAVAAAGDSLWRDLEELGRCGFRYSLDQVSDLDLDADALSARRFRFVKADAARLLAADSPVDPAALKRRLDSRGIDLVVEKIETEAMLLELLDLNIDFGQGYLFGEPRLSRAEA